ncbi:MAG: hypothetical protein LC745_00855 [Planctomycetia bacterium]|nr:hypothetical protein [Planctomycetia bacterium]
MFEGVPDVIPIEHDDYHAKHDGRTADGRQFFLTTPFRPKMLDDPGREFVALYLFDEEGHLLDAMIDDLGPRAGLDDDYRERLYTQGLAELGTVEFGRFEIRPFQLERFATTFGLIAQPPEDETDEGDLWCVVVEPGDVMAFFPPWDGDHDT